MKIVTGLFVDAFLVLLLVLADAITHQQALLVFACVLLGIRGLASFAIAGLYIRQALLLRKTADKAFNDIYLPEKARLWKPFSLINDERARVIAQLMTGKSKNKEALKEMNAEYGQALKVLGEGLADAEKRAAFARNKIYENGIVPVSTESHTPYLIVAARVAIIIATGVLMLIA